MIPYRARPQKDPEPAPLYEYSSTQVNITGKAAEAMRAMADRIPQADLGVEGREDQPHITIKWGLHFQSPSERMRQVIQSFGPIEATLGKTSLFSNDDADVLKIDVDSPDLHRLNQVMSRIAPAHNTHPKYVPHATIAYLKPGRGKKYSGNAVLAGQKLTFHSVTFSGKKGHREVLPLGPTMPGPFRVR